MRHKTEDADRAASATRLPLIRSRMAEQGLDGFIIPHEDEHQNEYLPPANDRLAWATGFTGSAGAAVVLGDRAALFIDGRYTLQVRDQADETLFEFHDLMDGGPAKWLESNLRTGDVVGYDPRLHSPDALARLKAAAEAAGARLAAVSDNPLDLAWGAERPSQPAAPVVTHPLEFAGESAADKRARIGKALGDADAVLLTSPASLAWLFNIRGADVAHSPLPLGQALVNKDGSASLFLDPAKWTPGLAEWLGEAVALAPPQSLPIALAALKGKGVMIDPAIASAWYFDALEAAGAKIICAPDPCALPRACKNTVEIEGAKRAHRRDGAAMAGFLHWLDTEAQQTLPDELEVAARLQEFREASGELKDLSFATIAGFGPNGAIVHYHATPRTALRLAPGSLLLVDSGGQYLDGTTDITRTVAIGEPTPGMRDRFTRVLKGHLALARARFPAGTPGSALDALARGPLWAVGLDFDHGTGHGVGSYLGVHEGPQNISKRAGGAGLQPGMILSNEPGYYKAGAFGIRIENLEHVVEAPRTDGTERPMLAFEALTLAPIDRRLIETGLMSPKDRAQLDAYHARVLREIGPLVEAPVRRWLETACAPLA